MVWFCGDTGERINLGLTHYDEYSFWDYFNVVQLLLSLHFPSLSLFEGGCVRIEEEKKRGREEKKGRKCKKDQRRRTLIVI